MSRPLIGVLALQGDVREHTHALQACGVDVVPVRRRSELAAVDGLVIPGGESTTMDRLLKVFELYQPLRERIADGLPVYGSCAGMILLADRILDGVGGQATVGGLDVTVRRNAFGRQVDSFEEDLDAPLLGAGPMDEPLHAVFIRAPWVEAVGAGVEVLATVRSGPAAGRIVAVRQGVLMATAFHPEIGSDHRVHRAFIDLVRAHRRREHTRR
ncbi:pyridoxal 5'-phosphate synthase glutaminase subunit PdxT [Occultella glacieicola]|uniref:Pyridoxal 5'-phosphate synthase subunit PdxT n=1 Tax=Occultella glacieicola TaxID=2518684 RepID=A0ABY2E1G2_9MICO|nr:pyridoxal 5'-phosphate synthase glutaminase subunit PdxT [Occultella glacieicola]TDE92458.1 pyridoxal 5'-phosphate synthase glutaminase subunit PdxT [Occultella glacieicola]